MPTVFEGGPYLNAAVLCERAIQETDGVLTIVRAVDKVVAQPRPGAGDTAAHATTMRPFPLSLSLVVLMKAGQARGDYTLAIRPQDPTGSQLPVLETPLSFAGTDDGQGVNVVINLNLGIQHEGLYWFDVLLTGELITRLPLRIEYRQAGDRLPPAPQAHETSG
jgi:hypothetical protein